MGNCITTQERITNHNNDDKRHDQFPTTTHAKDQHGSATKHSVASSKVSNAAPSSRPKVKKTVRFRLSEEQCGGSDKDENAKDHDKMTEGRGAAAGAGVPVRIRVLVTQEELKQILNYKSNNYASVEQLLRSMRLINHSRRISRVRDGSTNQPAGCNGGWSPRLDSIPEDS